MWTNSDGHTWADIDEFPLSLFKPNHFPSAIQPLLLSLLLIILMLLKHKIPGERNEWQLKGYHHGNSKLLFYTDYIYLYY